MNFSFLPLKFQLGIKNIPINHLQEIRLRKNLPVKIKFDNKSFYLCDNGQTLLKSKSIICDEQDISFVISNVCEHSIYAHNENIINGFLTTLDGCRIGVAGECVADNNKIITLKNFTSLNIRIPHSVEGCSDLVFNKIYSNGIYNTLIISPPFYGKTTIIKDLCKKINDTYDYSILLVDERGEFAKVNGENIDVIKYASKDYAFNCAIRSMSPDIIFADELSSKEDWLSVKKVVDSGVKIVATCHGKTILDVIKNSNFVSGVFNRYVILKSLGTPGKVESIYDEEFNKV